MSTTINFQPPDVPSSAGSTSAVIGNAGELGDFERPRSEEITFQELIKSQQTLQELKQFKPVQVGNAGEKGDSNELPGNIRNNPSVPRTSNWLLDANTGRSHVLEQRTSVRATKSHEFHMGRGRPLSRF